MTNNDVRIQKGLVLLTGESGRGKTTVLESVLYALYGTLKGQYAINTKSCTVSLTIEPDIVIQRNSGPARLSLQVGGQSYNGAHAQQIINELFGTEAIFLAGSYSRQGKKCAFLTASNEDKMSLLREISFRKDNVDIVYERIGNALKAIKNIIATAEREFLISQRELESHRKSFPKVDFSGVNVDELNIDEMNGELKQIETNIRKLDLRLKVVIPLETKISTLSSTLIPNLDGDETSFKAEIKRLRELRSKIRSDLNDLEVREKLKKAFTFQHEESLKLNDTVKKLSEEHGITDANTTSELNRILDARKTASQFKNALREFGVSSVGELRGQIGKLGTEIDEKKLDIQDAQTDLDAKRWNETQVSSLSCPACNVPLRYENNCLRQVDTQFKFEPKPVQNENVSDATILTLKHELHDLETKRSKIQSSIGGLVTMSLTVVEESEQDTKKLDAIQTRNSCIEKLRNLAGVTTLQPLEVTESADVLTVRLQETETTLNQLEMTLTQLETQKSRLAEIENSKKELGSDSSSHIEAQIQEEKDKLIETRELRDMAINIIKTVELEANHERNTKTLDGVNRKHEKLREMQNLAKQTEIKILERTVQVLNEQVNQFLSVMFPDEDRMTVKFSTTKETKSGKERMTCSLSVFYKNLLYDDNDQLSGGERDRLSLAVMLAVNSLTNGKFLLLDETLSTLGENSKLRILDMLKSFIGDQKRCIIVSHDIVEGTFDKIIHF